VNTFRLPSNAVEPLPAERCFTPSFSTGGGCAATPPSELAGATVSSPTAASPDRFLAFFEPPRFRFLNMVTRRHDNCLSCVEETREGTERNETKNMRDVRFQTLAEGSITSTPRAPPPKKQTNKNKKQKKQLIFEHMYLTYFMIFILYYMYVNHQHY
jgi:hypothetical protein